MKKYYENYKLLIIITTLFGVYVPAIEKIYGDKWYVKSLKLIFVLPSIALLIFFATYVKYVFYDGGQLSSKIYGVLLLVFASNSVYVFLTFNLGRLEFERIFELWDFLFQGELFPEDRQELLDKNRKFTIKWLLAFGAPSLCCSFMYCITMYFIPEKKLPHPSGIPYRHASPDFELVVTMELFAGIFGFSMLILFDSMTMVILSQEEAQFRYLKRSMSRIVEIIYVTNAGEVYLKNEQSSDGMWRQFHAHTVCVPCAECFEIVHAFDSWRMERAFEKAEEQLRVWVDHHKEILRFHDEVQRIYAGSFSVKYLIFILIICFCSFLAITGILNLKDIAMTIVFCFNLYATFYLNIRYADSTAETAESLFEDAFSKSWYLFPKKIRMAFLIIIMRCRRPVQYKILGVYPLNPRTFLKILTTSYTFFTFLLQVNKSKQ